MIGLMFLAGIALWFAVAVLLSKKIPVWLGLTKHKTVTTVLLFPILFVLPMADEIVGRWQFSRLCAREALVTLSPDWEKVKRAKEKDIPIVGLNGFVIRIRSQRMEYVDADSGKMFFSNQAFHTSGGFLFDRLGLGLGGSSSCWPEGDNQIYKKINLEELIKQGKSK